MLMKKMVIRTDFCLTGYITKKKPGAWGQGKTNNPIRRSKGGYFYYRRL